MKLFSWFKDLKFRYKFLIIFFVLPMVLAQFQPKPSAEDLARREQVKVERAIQDKIDKEQKAIQKEADKLQTQIYLSMAYTQKEIKNMLKSPNTAKFSDCESRIQPDGSYIISGYVDSQNSFGAIIRSTYEATWKNKEIIAGKFDGKELQIIRRK